MKNKLVSIIVPVYNEEKHIGECLNSIKIQTYSNIELIVIDDGSTDKTKEIAKQHADLFLTQSHQGPGIARNNAAKMAKGEILVFVDGDMYLDKNYIKNIIKPIVVHKAVATFTKDEYVANPENIWSKCFQIDNNLAFNKRIPDCYPSNSNMFRAIEKAVFVKSGGYNTKTGYGEDNILKSNNSKQVINAICYHYNPETLREVFLSARWVGRSVSMRSSIKNFLRYSIINSLNVINKKLFTGAPKRFAIYKIVFDFGIICGLISNIKSNIYFK